MTELELISKLQLWLYNSGFDCKVKSGDEICYIYSEETILFTTNNEEHTALYLDYCKKLGLTRRISYDAIAFLHELGHHENSDEDITYLEAILYNILQTPSRTRFLANLKAKLYYRLPNEKRATLWAIKYATLHPKQLARLERIFYKHC